MLCDKNIKAIFIDMEETGEPCQKRKREMGGRPQV